MDSSEELAALAERVESLSGPDMDMVIESEIDRLIAASHTGPRTVPIYTSNLNWALTLVPEGYEWQVGFTTHDFRGTASIWQGVEGDGEWSAAAATPALALCAAALRARAQVS